MKQIKKWWGNLPTWAKALIIIALGYYAFKFIKGKIELMKLKSDLKDDGKSYANTGYVTSLNLHASVKEVWLCFYGSELTEDEETVVRVINSVPSQYRLQFNQLYGEYLIEKRDTIKGGLSGLWRHYGTSLQEDCKHFLSNKEYISVSHFFNSL